MNSQCDTAGLKLNKLALCCLQCDKSSYNKFVSSLGFHFLLITQFWQSFKLYCIVLWHLASNIAGSRTLISEMTESIYSLYTTGLLGIPVLHILKFQLFDMCVIFQGSSLHFSSSPKRLKTSQAFAHHFLCGDWEQDRCVLLDLKYNQEIFCYQ